MPSKAGSLVLWILLGVVCLPGHGQDQDSASPPLGDVARQARKNKAQADNSQPSQGDHGGDAAEAREIAGLKAAPFKANILITDSHSAIEKWVLSPATEKPGTGRLRQVTPGTKIYVSFVVTDYTFPVSERMNLTHHVRFVKPNGKVLDIPPTSATIQADPRSPSVIVLNPVLDITFDPDDNPGTYTFSVLIIDHVHSTYAKAEEQLDLIWKF
jgi:hypothetical protein